NADDEGRDAVARAKEFSRRIVKALRRRDIQRQQARQREVYLYDFVERDRVVQRLEPRQVVVAERERRVLAEVRPFGAREDRVWSDDRRRHLIHQGLVRAAFSARPLCRVRFSSSLITASSEIPRACNMTSRW